MSKKKPQAKHSQASKPTANGDCILSVIGVESNDKHTTSEILLNDVKLCVSIEDPLRDIKITGRTGIPNGEYELGFTQKEGYSERWFRDEHGNIIYADDRTTEALKEEYHTAHEMIEVKDVEGFEKVCLNWGNTVDETEGDILVGSRFGTMKGRRAVLESRKTYQIVYPTLYNAIKNGSVKAVLKR